MLQPIRVADLNWDPASYVEALLARVGIDMGQTAAVPIAAVSAQEAMVPFIPRVTVPDDPALVALIERAEILLRAPTAVPAGAAPHSGRVEAMVRQLADVTGEVLVTTESMVVARLLIGEAGPAPLMPFDQQAAALAGIERAIAALNAGRLGYEDSLFEQKAAPPNLLRERLLREWAGRIERGAPDARQLWPCADGYVTWSFADDPSRMRAMVARLAEDGTAGLLADVDWDTMKIAEVPRETLVVWAERVAAWFLTKTGAVLADISERHVLGLSVLAD